MKKKQDVLLLPSNFDRQNFNHEHPLYLKNKEDDKARLIEVLSYFVTTIYDARLKNSEINFVPIKMAYVRSRFPGAELYIQELIKRNILLCDGIYLKREKSFGYKMLYPYNSTPLITYVNEPTSPSNDKIRICAFDKESKTLPFLYKNFNHLLEINTQGALKEGLEKYWRYDGEKLPIFFSDVNFDELHQFKLIRRADEFTSLNHRKAYNELISAYLIPISKLCLKLFFFNVDKSGYRLFTNLTSLKKELRKHVTYDGKRLISWDIRNSQPFFLNIILNKDFWRGEGNAITYKILRGDMGNKVGLRRAGINTTITMQKIDRMQHSYTFQDFKNQSIKGILYDDLCRRINNRFEKPKYTREQIMSDFIKILFDKPRQMRDYEYKIEGDIEMEFPGLLSVIDCFKLKKPNLLALLLQQIESHIVLRIVCPAIAKKYPKIPLFTIHDCIITTEGNEELIKPIIEREIELATGGLKPILKLEKWS